MTFLWDRSVGLLGCCKEASLEGPIIFLFTEKKKCSSEGWQ